MRKLSAVTLLTLAVVNCSGCQPANNAGPPVKAASSSTSSIDRVRAIVSKQLAVPIEKVTPKTTLGELGADSLDYVELIMEFEDAFSISIPDDKPLDLAGDQESKDLNKKVTVQILSDLVDELVREK